MFDTSLTADQLVETALIFAGLLMALVAWAYRRDAQELRLDLAYQSDREGAVKLAAQRLRDLVTNHLAGGKGHPLSKALRSDLDLACGDVEAALVAYELHPIEDAMIAKGETDDGQGQQAG